jgi:2-amino-4-hydroxy-6-hydroxymethyldihydropteridine diphosphokinase
LQLQQVERLLGKVDKPKEAPRVIDLDILFFGMEIHRDKKLEIPHPSWMERLFVLIPLSDLVRRLMIPDPLLKEGKRVVDLLSLIQSFRSDHHQVVKLL